MNSASWQRTVWKIDLAMRGSENKLAKRRTHWPSVRGEHAPPVDIHDGACLAMSLACIP